MEMDFDERVRLYTDNGIRTHHRRLLLVSDNGSQPTSLRFMQDCQRLKIKQVFTSYNNPKGNADTERVIHTLKEDLVWPREFETVAQLHTALEQWVEDYNQDYPIAIPLPRPFVW